ncbi:MAG: hypothetical protein Roseis2KO_52780 [Roseivirga sp.]
MYDNEYLFFNSLKGFRGPDDDGSGRFDPRELNVKNEQLTTLTIITDSKEIHLHEELQKFNGQFIEHLSEPKINCCSLHWMEIEPEEPASTYHDNLLGMGDKTLLIFDWKRFFEILDNSLESQGLQYSRRKVTYYDPKTYSGEMTLHHKDHKLSWQNEYRVLIAPTQNKPIRVNLPGLKEISHVVETINLPKLRIKFAPTSDNDGSVDIK